jgi:RNA polymerase sigma factor (sigma-70 family)
VVAAIPPQLPPARAASPCLDADLIAMARSASDADLTCRMARFRDSRRSTDFEELYRAARAEVLAWVLHFTGRQRVVLDPFDLVQDTFVNIYRYAQGFRTDDDTSFRRWARTIAGNVVRRAARARLGSFPLASLGALAVEPSDPAPGPQHGLEQRESTRAVERAYGLVLLHYAAAFAALAPRDQRALTLVEVEGRTYREVADELGVGLSNTKMIVFRARQRLRARLERALGAGTAAVERAA